MASIGRNHPCPCGSGKKYKACCLDRFARGGRGGESEYANPEDKMARFKAQVLADLADFAVSVHKKVGDQGRALYLRLDDLDEGDQGEEIFPLDEADLDEWNLRMMMGVMFDLPAREDGELVAEAYLRKRAARLSEDEKAWLRQLLEAPLAFYEIVDVDPGVGLHVVDLGTQESWFIHESEVSNDLEGCAIIAVRKTFDGLRHGMEAGYYRFEPDDKPTVQEEMTKYLKEHGAPSWSDLDRMQRRLFSIVIHSLWNEVVLDSYDIDPDSPEVRANLALDILEADPQGWVDTPLVALGSETPRNFARTSEGRIEIAGLLGLESSRTDESGDSPTPPLDFSWIRKELRLPSD